MKIPGIVLASDSPRRREILSGLGLEFITASPSSVEIPDFHSPTLVPIINARLKAGSISPSFPSSIVIGADTVIEISGSIMGKPCCMDDARRMLKLLSGRSHSVVTGLCMSRLDVNAECVFCDTTEVVFKKLTAAHIDEYLLKVAPLDKAGAYAIQEHGEMIIERISGSMDNVIGFPTEKFLKAFSLWTLEGLL